jgi:hypothetical protein
VGLKVLYRSLEDLFVDVRVHARETDGPNHQRIVVNRGFNPKVRERNAVHTVPYGCQIEHPRKKELIEVPAGTTIVLYQEVDPDPPLGFGAQRLTGHSIGTLKLPNLEMTLRGNGKVSCKDPNNIYTIGRSRRSGAYSTHDE